MKPADLLKILPGLLKIVGNVTGLSAVKDAADALGGVNLSPEKQAELEIALGSQMVEVRKVEAEELKAILAEHIEEVKSDDAYVRRARPTGLYVFYLVSVAVVIGLLLKIDIDPTAILTVIGPLAGVGGYYVGNRTREKVAP